MIELGHLDTVRKEANEVKDCFTRYSFQAFAFESAILGLILKYQVEEPFVTFAVLFGIVLMILVSRIGTHKYATANRNFGFELFLSESENFNHEVKISWEQALRGWRIVQATLFAELFHTEGRHKDRPRQQYAPYFEQVHEQHLSPNFFRKQTPARDHQKTVWFMPTTLLPAETKFHPGAYLRTMLRLQRRLARWSNALFVLPTIHFLASTPIWDSSDLMALQHEQRAQMALCGVFLLTGFASLMVVNVEYRRRFARLRLLEEGILSIHSCSRMWHAIVVAHMIAEKRVRQDTNLNYITELGKLAKELKDRILNLDAWISQYSSQLPPAQLYRQRRCRLVRRKQLSRKLLRL